MFIDFEKITTTTIANFRGGEKEFNAKIYNDAVNKIMKVTLAPGASIGMHKHEQESEIVYVLQGTGKAIYDASEEVLSVGKCHYCPQGHSHSVINTGTEDLILFAIIPQHA